MPDNVSTFWLGDRMGPLERACLRSFLRLGHPVTLYTYASVDGCPEGLTMAPADEIVPRPVLDGLSALPPVIFSDYFRYKLQQLGRGTWVDSDVYCVKPFVFEKKPVFGWQKRDGWQGKRYLNNAISGWNRIRR